jgi:hypothetical protein
MISSAHESTAESEDASSTGASSRPARGGGGRRAKFSSHLTDAAGPSAQVLGAAPRAERASYTHPALVAGDLTSTLIDSLRTPPYPDCPICFSAIHPAQPSWSCSPTAPVAPVDGEEVESGPESARCCWTTFHLKCIRAWAGKSVKDVADAWRARGENRPGDWRCPGCQAKRISVPSGYWSVTTTLYVLPILIRLQVLLWSSGRPKASPTGHATFVCQPMLTHTDLWPPMSSPLPSRAVSSLRSDDLCALPLRQGDAVVPVLQSRPSAWAAGPA